jgi:hypothetical protein
LLSELVPRLKVIAVVCLLATAALALTVAHGRSPYAFERPALAWLGPPSAVSSWSELAKVLAAPLVSAFLVVAFVLGLVRRAPFRVVFYVALAAAAFFFSELVAKPLVQRTYDGELTFPSGSVTAVSGTALAMWLALYPVLGKRARKIMLMLGIASTILVSVAVVGGHWHTPLDAVGSILLSVSIVSAGAVVFEPVGTRRSFTSAEARSWGRPKEE